ncbi:Sec-independent protein translocase subunit TatA [Yinghuangia sp. ASG 101]|uniref:Sec-independent protein translocase subunit TatA n=1 Tax=Yinghuangia sp. ASG 101 TaxID=2896848 RepID=UPI001E44F6C3|nr:Sec-independent protein translocase subunit TatA [Yinghuangia sp. ASG 101]UGQ11581.1 Sec-independent protein translocase subunit TatA [Yinghuangia sp. ASG 101]
MVRNGLEPWHLLVVAVVAILLFGPQRLPDAARALGRSLRILKSETRAMKTEDTPDRAPEPVRWSEAAPAPEAVAPAEHNASGTRRS